MCATGCMYQGNIGKCQLQYTGTGRLTRHISMRPGIVGKFREILRFVTCGPGILLGAGTIMNAPVYPDDMSMICPIPDLERLAIPTEGKRRVECGPIHIVADRCHPVEIRGAGVVGADRYDVQGRNGSGEKNGRRRNENSGQNRKNPQYLRAVTGYPPLMSPSDLRQVHRDGQTNYFRRKKRTRCAETGL